MRRLLLLPVLGLGFLLPIAPLQGQDAPVPASRPDSLRTVILDRVRGTPEAPPEAPPPAQDPAEPDTAAVPGVPVVTAPDLAPRIYRAEAPSGSDALMRSLLEMEGFTSASYEGERADFSAATRRLELFGIEDRRARFFGRGVRLESDSSIVFDDRDGRVRTTGLTDFTPEQGDPVRSQRITYDLSQERGTALGAETTYTEGGMWIVRGDLDSVQEGLLFGTATRFTSCDLDPPHSYFQASELKVVANRVLVARSVQMYVEDVPIVWLPFVAQNLGSGRASGILTPTFSVNDVVRTSTGYNRRVSNLGYYWAMSDYSDLTLAMDWYSNNYTALQGSFRYRWARQFLDGTVNLKQYWRDTGRRELGFDTRHAWEISERSRLSVSGRFISSSDFVRQNSFDPRELNQTVDSDAALTRRFDWGNLTLGSSRRQHLNEERTDMTLPSGSLSLSTLTLLAAPPQSARWYNNISVTGSTNWNRRINERELQPDTAFVLQRASQARTQGSMRGSFGLGDLSLSGTVETVRTLFRDVPSEMFVPMEVDPFGSAGLPRPAGWSSGDPFASAEGRGDFRAGEVSWSTSLSFRQRLIGSTHLTPNVSLSGRMVQVDSIPEAQSFIQGPTRASFGVGLQTEVYGFYPGFGPFEAVRHKITPSVNWAYAPEVQPTDLQVRVFGARVASRQNTLGFGFNQTWEARVSEPEPAAVPAPVPPELPDAGVGEPVDPDAPGAELPDETEPTADTLLAPATQTVDDGGPRRLPPSRVVTLLALQSGMVTYDIVQADSTGRFVDGFTTTSLSNTVSSDYLQGLSLSFTHDLFDDSERLAGGRRTFSPHLSQLSLGFALSDRSTAVRTVGRWLGLEPSPHADRDPAAEAIPEPAPPDGELEDPFDPRSGFDPNRVIPGTDDPDELQTRREGWNARIQYSLRRPRDSGIGSALRAQMVQGSLSFAPTANWSVNWSTSFDVEEQRFNDHVVRLNRDLHEWEATFGFRQTATGNWAFHFEVSLRANRDLRLDYEQRGLQDPRPPGF